MKDRTWDLLEAYLDQDFLILPMAPNKSSEQDIQEIESLIGITFPEAYKLHLIGEKDELLEGRGICVEVKELIWQRPKILDVAPFWSFLYGFHTYTASKESEDWMRLEVVANDFLENTGIKAAPILKVIGDADLYCVDENGIIVIYRHEENSIESINMTFWEVLEFELKELKQRKERKIKEDTR